jgi:hypothetical protein
LLHVLSFLIAGLVVAGTFRLARFLTNSRLALAAALIAAVVPVFLVQAMDIYLDLPLSAAVIWTLTMAVEGRLWSAVLLSALACAIKPTGLVVIPPVAATIASDKRRPKWPLFAGLGVAGTLVVVPIVLLNRAAPIVGREPGLETVRRSLTYLENHIDILVLVLLVLVFGAFGFMQRRRERRVEPGTTLILWIALVSYWAFFALHPLVLSAGVPALPRYSVVVVPILSVLLVKLIADLRSRIGIAVIPLLILILLLNWFGTFNSPDGNFYTLSERSLSYSRHVRVQAAALSAFESIAQEMPTYYDHFTHYRFQYPEMGWSARGPIDGEPVYLHLEEFDNPSFEFPNEFAVLYEAPWLGGEVIGRIVDRAVEDPMRHVEDLVFKDGPFENHIYIISTVEEG